MPCFDLSPWISASLLVVAVATNPDLTAYEGEEEGAAPESTLSEEEDAAAPEEFAIRRRGAEDCPMPPPGAPNYRGTNQAFRNFHGYDLRWADFTGAYAPGAKFNHVPLSNACFFGTILRQAEFVTTTLDNVNGVGADFTNTKMQGAKLVAGSNFYGADFRHAQLQMHFDHQGYAYRSRLSASFVGVRFGNANLGGADLRGGDFYGADFCGASVAGVICDGTTDFTGAACPPTCLAAPPNLTPDQDVTQSPY